MRKLTRYLAFVSIILVISLVFVGCGNKASKDAEKQLTAGIYKGSAKGFDGDINVSTEIDKDGKISKVTVESHNETKGFGTVAVDKIPSLISKKNSLKVDGIAGATVSSNAICAAVADSIKTAGGDPKKFDYSPKQKKEFKLSKFDKDSLPKQEKKTGTVTVTDARGRNVEIKLPVSRYAVSTMDVVDFAIPIMGKDAFNKLVGSGQDGGHGLQGYGALYTPIIGDYTKHTAQISDHNAPFDLEMILTAQPDVLIVNSAMGAHKYAMEIEPKLKEAGIPVVLIDVPGKSIAQSPQETIKILGQIFQKEKKAEEVNAFLDKQFKIISDKNLQAKQNKPTVYYEKSGYSEILGSTSSSKTGWGTVIDIAGGNNIADAVLGNTPMKKGGGASLDPEYVLKSNPKFVILSGSGAGWMDNFKGNKPEVPKFDIVNRNGWNKMQAVKNGDVYELAHAMSRSVFGFYACQKLAKTFYPKEFKDVNVDKNIKEFFKKYMLTDSDVTIWFTQYQKDSAK